MAESFLTLMAEYCPEDQERISVWYDALQHAGFTGEQTPGLKHHITLATFPVEYETEAILIAQQVAARFAPMAANIRHIGVMPGGKVLFAAPDMTPALVALQKACDKQLMPGYPWLPHTTMMIGETVEEIAAALPTLAKHFTPIPAKIDRLRLCAFWPTREIISVELTGKE